MNHGRCKNCWWLDPSYSILPAPEVQDGHCYMQGGRITRNDSYCPDYINREKETKKNGQTLVEWRNKML